MKQILITGDRSGSGKTSITLALAALLSQEHRVQTFKVGMDYIDPSYLTAVSGRPCRNLDSFTLSDAQIRDIFRTGAAGLTWPLSRESAGCTRGRKRSRTPAALLPSQRLLDLPVVLVVSAQSITRSSAAIVKGIPVL